MGCSSSTDTGGSRIWVNIQNHLHSVSDRQTKLNSDRSRVTSTKQSKRDRNRKKTYFEPCLLYLDEPGHQDYHLNDIGLYENDIELTIKKPRSQKRPKYKGLFEDDAFDDFQSNIFRDVSLLRPKEIVSHPNSCSLQEIGETNAYSETLHRFDNIKVNITLLEDDSFLLKRVVPGQQSKRYRGIFHCRFYRCGIWESIYVDDRLPVGKDGLALTGLAVETGEVWKQLLFKAFAKSIGGYENAEKMRFLEVFRAFTGGTGCELRRQPVPQLLTQISTGLEQGSIVVCSIALDQGETGLHEKQIILIQNVVQVSTTQNQDFSLLLVRHFHDGMIWSGPWNERSTAWDNVPEASALLASLEEDEFFISAECLRNNMDVLTICNLVPEQQRLASEARSNYITKIYSEWKDSSAAGLYFLRNPKYLIHMSSKGIESDGKIRLVIILERSTQIIDNVTVGIKLYIVKIDCKEGILLEEFPEDVIYSSRLTSTTSIRVVPGEYLLVPHSTREDYQGEITIEIFTPTPLSCVRFIENSTPIVVTKEETKVRMKGQKLLKELLNVERVWGRWDLQNGNRDGKEFHRNPQMEIIIHENNEPNIVKFDLLKECLHEEVSVGFRLFKLSNGIKLPLNHKTLQTVLSNPIKCHDGSIEGWHGDHISPTYLLHPGTYGAIVWADTPNTRCTFCLVVRSLFSLEIRSVNR